MKKFFITAATGIATPVCAVDLPSWPGFNRVQDAEFFALVGRVYLFH